MTITETARLIDWLVANGHSAEVAVRCIKFIATGVQPDNKPDNKPENKDNE